MENKNNTTEILQTKILMNTQFENINLLQIAKEKILILTDTKVYTLHKAKFENYLVIQIPEGEQHKTQTTVDDVVQQMLQLNIDKTYTLIAVGGGVVTDLGGYVASIYKRGIPLGLVPTTILGMTDAAIGGKNGVNVGLYKNMVGTIYRPSFILYDFSFLYSLPKIQWINGFAEIIKHACIKDKTMFEELSTKNVNFYLNNTASLISLVEKNVAIKMEIVAADEFEKADRYLLNFGHTFGHAIENKYSLPHGFAVSIGMVIASSISEKVCGLPTEVKFKIEALLKQYELPTFLENINIPEVLALLQKDKKREADAINFVLLKNIGDAITKKITFLELAQLQSA